MSFEGREVGKEGRGDRGMKERIGEPTEESCTTEKVSLNKVV